MRTRHKFIETLATSERYVIINSGIKEAAVPNIPYRKINCWKMNYCQFQQDGFFSRIG